MKPFVWQEGMTDEETKNGAYWERNMLAVLLGVVMNNFNDHEIEPICGWYDHQGDGFEGWSRVISIGRGDMTFHVPDGFNLGKLPKIEPNWNGHTTEEKWKVAMNNCGIDMEV